MIGVGFMLGIIEHNERVKREAAQREYLLSLPPDRQAFELRLMEIRALEAQARRPVNVHVKTSIF